MNSPRVTSDLTMAGMKWWYDPAPRNDGPLPSVRLRPASAPNSRCISSSGSGAGMFSGGLRCSAGMSANSSSMDEMPSEASIPACSSGVLGM